VKPLLFVTNGHGEAAIAAALAAEVRARDGGATEHFPLVGAGFAFDGFPEVGPRRAMPSGGLVAMGNVANFTRDLRAGWLGLFAAQLAFLGRAARGYRGIVAVGDTYAVALGMRARLPLAFVGTAKSAYVAPYDAVERAFLRRARFVFVRDAATARALRSHGVAARAPGNVIVDLAATDRRFPWTRAERVVVLPGSRDAAYRDVVPLAAAQRALAARRGPFDAALSVAPNLDVAVLTRVLGTAGWTIAAHADRPETPFTASATGLVLTAWRGPLGALFAGASLAFGQAGTANEAAAAMGLPVVALETAHAPKAAWYRMRQARLLGDALRVVDADPERAADALAALLDDPVRRAAMAAAGRERMGGPGAAAAIGAVLAAFPAAA
jgi:tetraacyldisaccharide 4'-kinase